MRKFYSTSFCGWHSSIVKTFLTIFSLFFLNATEIKAQAGNHLIYDGTNDFTTIGNNVVSSLSADYTVEFWVLWKGDAGAGTAFQRFFDFGVPGDPFSSPWMFFTPDIGGNTLRFAISTNGLTGFQAIDANIAFPQNAWTHVALVQNGTTFTIYINGTAVISGPVTIHPSDLGNTTENWIGKSHFGSDPYLNGAIDEFRISNIARYLTNFAPVPPTEFNPATANTIALYHFNEGSGQTTADAEGTYNGFLGTDQFNPDPSDPAWATNSILPITLKSVSASIVNSSVDVKWSASLDRESEFVVERSSNGTNFSPIGSIKRNNGTNDFETFSFRDNKPLNGRSFYRLKCIESGSPAFYSRIVGVLVSAKEDFVVYPNPTKGMITVELAKEYTGNVEITVSSTSGAVVLKQKIVAANRKEFQITRPASILPGTYIVEIDTGGQKQTKTIIYQ